MTLLLGMLIGFIITRKFVDKQLRDNPPITERQIKAMYAEMGRKPSEKQIKKVMQTMRRPQKGKGRK